MRTRSLGTLRMILHAAARVLGCNSAQLALFDEEQQALVICIAVANHELPMIDRVATELGFSPDGAVLPLAVADSIVVRSFRAALLDHSALMPSASGGQGLARTLATCLAFTWLNPHVYLDTVVLLGSVSTQYAGNKAAFGVGAGTASFLFFFSLGYGARLLRPLFARPGAWRGLDALIGATMCGLALRLVV